MLRVREIILNADSRMAQCVKWSTPTFTFQGNLASFNPRAKQYISLLVHTGASIPGNHPRLSGGGGTSLYMRFADREEVEAARPELEAVVRSWCAMKQEEEAPPSKGRAMRSAASAKAVSRKPDKRKTDR